MKPERLTVEALVRLPHQLVMVVGLAWLPDGAEIEMDDEHDDYAWWPADVADWPAEADEPLRRMATLLAAAQRMTGAADVRSPEVGLVHALGDLHRAARRLARAGAAGLEAIFGMAHGLGWIAMSLACIAALRLRVIDLRLAVAVAVLGGIGPFIGSYEFVRQSRGAAPRRPRAPTRPPDARLTLGAQPAASSSTATLTARVMSAP